MVKTEKVRLWALPTALGTRVGILTETSVGGKVKPLKQAKKGPKDLDEDDKAYLEKKRAGT